MSIDDAAAQVAQLRHRRRDMRRELARVRWWRRLIEARRDLSVAALTDAQELDSLGLDDAWEALAADAPTPAELAAAVWPDATIATPSSVEALSALDARLKSYEERVSDNLETVTAQMVRALGDAHRAAARTRGGGDA